MVPYEILSFFVPLVVFSIVGVNLRLLLRPQCEFLLSECFFFGCFATCFPVFLLVWLSESSLRWTFLGFSLANLALLPVLLLIGHGKRERLAGDSKGWSIPVCAALFLVFSFALSSVFLGKQLQMPPTLWDEFHMWNLNPKAIYLCDDVIRPRPTTFPLLSYPPLYHLWAAFVSICRGDLVEGAPRGVNLAVLLLSLLFVFEWTAGRTASVCLGAIASLLCFLLFRFLPVDLVLNGRFYFYRSYVDGSTSALLGLAILRLTDLSCRGQFPDTRTLFYVSIWPAILVFAKPIGVLLAAYVCLAVIPLFACRKSKNPYRVAIPPMCMALIPILTAVAFRAYLLVNRVTETSSNLRLNWSKERLASGASALKSMASALTAPDKLGSGFLPTYIVLLATILFLACYGTARKPWRLVGSRKRFSLWAGSLVLSLFFFYKVFLLWLGYTFLFSREEAAVLHSMDRYLSYGSVTVALGFVLMVVPAVSRWKAIQRRPVKWTVLLFALAGIALLQVAQSGMKDLFEVHPLWERYEQVASDLWEKERIRPDERVVLVAQGDSGQLASAMVYHLFPCLVSRKTSFGEGLPGHSIWDNSTTGKAALIEYCREERSEKILVVRSDSSIDGWFRLEGKPDSIYFIQLLRDGAERVTTFSFMTFGNIMEVREESREADG